MRTSSGAPDVNIIDAHNVKGFEFVDILKRRKGNPGKRKPPIYKNILCAFDIETSNILHDHNIEAIMYIWQMAIGSADNAVIIGRTWCDFVRIVNLLEDQCGENEYFIVFVHNLSFEFQFLKSVLTFEPESVFCLDDRKILRAVSGHLEFRCSYMQTNQSLSSFTREYRAAHVKLSGEDFDYSIKRFPWSRLNDEELAYCVNDVLGLIEAMNNRMSSGGDDLNTLPLTSTGYVRRLVKKSMRTFYRPRLIALQPDEELYRALRSAFRGGDTHANRFYTGLIIDEVVSMDITSSYPYSQLAYLYPMSQFIKSDERWSIDDILMAKEFYNRAFLFKARFSNLKLKDDLFGFPYIPTAKLEASSVVTRDNGRVLKAEYVELWLTDIDYEIISNEYQYDIDIIEVYISQYGKLPEQIRNIIIDLFREKSKLKGVCGYEMQYALIKAMLNAVYGLTAQDVGKPLFKFDGAGIYLDFEKTLADILAAARKSPYMAYQWGVWCTAHARRRLHRGLWSVYAQGAEPVYVDTDSIKYIGPAEWAAINAECTKVGITAETVTGERSTMGTYTYDGHYKRFLTYGAKKYAVEDDEGRLHITIAGVAKKKGAAELAAAGGLEALKEGFTFHYAAGAAAHYNDHDLEVIPYRDHFIELSSNVALTQGTYTLGLTGEYEDIVYDSRLLANAKEAIDLLFNMR